jgi:hypothetical protein
MGVRKVCGEDQKWEPLGRGQWLLRHRRCLAEYCDRGGPSERSGRRRGPEGARWDLRCRLVADLPCTVCRVCFDMWRDGAAYCSVGCGGLCAPAAPVCPESLSAKACEGFCHPVPWRCAVSRQNRCGQRAFGIVRSLCGAA